MTVAPPQAAEWLVVTGGVDGELAGGGVHDADVQVLHQDEDRR
ncbi:MAG TPA: hypothetical protein VF060_20995 [Trebonia sp.]